ncbi:MAG: hypothetical protein KME17_28280 [Cyanosarcina radialis HA8281-LM2]|jgi:hypothetical protein|nr:hypothetical protein [Cyanosarcina radialis HA8281-LM2]
MTTYVFRSLKAIAKRLSLLLVTVVAILSLVQTAAIAASDSAETEAPVAPSITEQLADENVDEMREQRREWQSQVSSSDEAKNDESKPLGETLKEKLNLDEITEGYNPEKSS